MDNDLLERLRFYHRQAAEIAERAAEAADAIEELQKNRVCRIVEKDGETELFIENRWIPVTERLPDAEPGDVSEQVLVTDGKCVAIVEWFNFECEPFWGYTGFGKDVTHWMPLPEPPKEETNE